MAACKLDQLWDGWAKTFTASYTTTVRCLEEGKTADAHKEYKKTFHPAIKRIYSEAAVTCPERYAGFQDWAAWLRHLYALSVKTDKALRKAANSVESRDAQAEAQKTATANLRLMHERFYILHEKTKSRRINDYLHRFHVLVNQGDPPLGELRRTRTAMDKAALSIKAKADPKTFAAAKARWQALVDQILASSAIEASQLRQLRTATETFYRAYGLQLE